MADAGELPNDKQELLDVKNYEVYNRDLVRYVFPRIIREAHDMYDGSIRKRPEIRDIVFFYFLLQAYIDGRRESADGTASDRFGACFLSYEAIMEHMSIGDRGRIKYLADILETNGIIRVADRYDGIKRFKWYFPSFCPRVRSDGYLVDEFGEKVTPNLELYKPVKRRPKKSRKAAS